MGEEILGEWSVIRKSSADKFPLPVRLLERTTLPRRFRTRFIGVGFRPQHVKTPDVYR